MPWKEMDAMSLRKEFVALAETSREQCTGTVSSLSDQFTNRLQVAQAV